jgi:integrase
MPASPNHVPAYRHYTGSPKNPKDLAVVRINGKDHYLGKYGSAESWEKYHRLLAERFRTQAGPVPDPQNDPEPLSITEVCVRYYAWALTYYVKDGKPTEMAHIVRRSLKTLRALFGSVPARDFGPLNLKTIQAAYVQEGLCRNEVNRRVGLCKAMFKWAVSEELIPPSVYQGVVTVRNLMKNRTPAPDYEPVGPVPDAVVERTLPFLPPTFQAMVRLQLLTGMRPGELLAMRPCDLTTTGAIWEYKPPSHKTEHHNKNRVVMIGPRAQEVLQPYLGLELSLPVFSPKRVQAERFATLRANRKTPLWPSSLAQQAAKRVAHNRLAPGDRYTVCSYRHMVWRACDRANPHPTLNGIAVADMTPEQKAELKAWRKEHRWHPNQLRHSAGTKIRREFGLEVSRAVLGHSEAETTLIYAERDLTAAKEAAARLG